MREGAEAYVYKGRAGAHMCKEGGSRLTVNMTGMMRSPETENVLVSFRKSKD